MVQLRHVGVTVSNLSRSIGFYEALGFEVLFEVERKERFIGRIVGIEGAHLKIAMLRNGDATIELLQYISPISSELLGIVQPYKAGTVHLCFEGQAIRDAMEKLSGAGEVRRRGVEQTIPDGPQKGARVAYWRGPDDEIIETFVPPPKSEIDTIIDAVEVVRARNNKLWVGVTRIAMELAPERARELFDQIEANDLEIRQLTAPLREKKWDKCRCDPPPLIVLQTNPPRCSGCKKVLA